MFIKEQIVEGRRATLCYCPLRVAHAIDRYFFSSLLYSHHIAFHAYIHFKEHDKNKLYLKEKVKLP